MNVSKERIEEYKKETKMPPIFKNLLIIFAILLLSVILCLSFCTVLPAVSAVSSNWVLDPYAEYITQTDKKYVYMDLSDKSYYFDYESHALYEQKLNFADDKTADRYRGSHILFYKDAEDVAVQMEAYKNNRYEESRLYVEESHLEEYKNIAQGIADDYLIYSYYSTEVFRFSGVKYDDWSDSGTITVDANSLSDYDCYYIFATDDKELFEVECGMVLYDYYHDKLYLLKYSDYDSSYFYSDGGFNEKVDKEVTLYLLEDDPLEKEIVNFVNTEPKDDLDWLVSDHNEVNDTVAIVFCSIVFGIIPLATFVFAIVMLIMVKDKKYRRPYTAIAFGSLLVLVSCAVVLLMLI